MSWNRQGGRNDAPAWAGLKDEEVKGILASRGDVIANKAKELADALHDVERAQIRNFYGPMTRIRESSMEGNEKLNELHLMRPRLVYMAARQRKAEPLKAAFETLITKATSDNVAGIFLFAEAVVGYHRAHKS